MKNLFWLTVLIAIAYTLFTFVANLFSSFLGLLRSSDPTISVVMITGAVTLIANVTIKLLEKRMEIDREHRQRKIEIYQKFLPNWLDMLSNDELKTMKTEKDRLVFLKEGIGDLIAYSSGGVLKAFVKFREGAVQLSSIDQLTEQEKAKQMIAVFILYEKVILEIRRDLGHKDFISLQGGDLMRIFVNDYTETERKAKK